MITVKTHKVRGKQFILRVSIDDRFAGEFVNLHATGQWEWLPYPRRYYTSQEIVEISKVLARINIDKNYIPKESKNENMD